MPHHDEKPRASRDGLRTDDPGRVGGPEQTGPGRADRPAREAVRGRHPGRHAWLWLTLGLVGLVVGIVIGHGLLLAAGLVVAGMSGQLLDPQRSRGRGGVPGTR
ncbi:hypothetical protein [Streptomyces sp. ALB3]|uniref:hypothetical protein n=1 Tax=Streptomyces sp. ALB3 TaxID=3374278 RepID=UPI00378CB8CD